MPPVIADHAQVRRWLVNLRRPDRLDDPALRELLRAHGRGATGPGLRAGSAGAALLREKIETLRPPADAPASAALPYRVLKTCFVEGAKSYQAAGRLGLSERQLSRERARAVALLAAELRVTAPAPPVAPGLVARPGLTAELGALLAECGAVHVTGPPGSGKTTLVAAFTAGAGPAFTHSFVAHVGAGLPSLLFELAEHLAPDDASLASYFRSALPRPNVELAARVALAALRGAPRLLVLDDSDAAGPSPALDAFLHEVRDRLPSCPLITAGCGPPRRAVPALHVPPLTPSEVRALLALHGVDDESAAREVHAVTRGNARLAALSAACLAGGQAGAARALAGAAGAGGATVRALAGLMWRARRPAA